MDPTLLLSARQFADKHGRCKRPDYLGRVSQEAFRRARRQGVVTGVYAGRHPYHGPFTVKTYPEDFLYRVFMDVHA